MVSRLERGGKSTPEARGSARSASQPPAYRVLHVGDGLATAELGSHCLILWREPVNHRRYLLQREALELVTSRHADGAQIMCVIEPTNETPSEELRTEASRLLASLAPRIRKMAYVIEGSGFRAAMIRGVLSSIELLRSKPAFATRFFADTSAASSWLAEGPGGLRDTLVNKVAGLREELTRVDRQATRG